MKPSWRRFKPSTFAIPKSWREFIWGSFRYIVIFVLLVVIGGGGFAGYKYYLGHTEMVAATGGTFVEGMAGQPKLINPILAQTNDIDRDLCKLIFNGLLMVNHDRELVGDLADRWDVSEDGKTYTIYLRPDIKWHDGQPLTADDVVFTYKLIQDPGYPGTLAKNWQDVSIEKVDNLSVKFTLPSAFSPFLANLTTGILPQHLLTDVSAAKLDAASFNTQPVGTGIYQLKKLKITRDGTYDSIELTVNPEYFGDKPKIENIIFKFYTDYQQLYRAYNNKELMSLARILIPDWPQVSATVADTSFFNIALPQYTAVFINQDGKKILRDPYLKEAIAYGIDRERIVKEVVHGLGQVIDTPILEGYLGHNPDIPRMNYDIAKAKEVLETGRWTDIDADGIYERDNVRLSLTIVTSDNPALLMAAQIIKENLTALGFDIQLESHNIGDLEDQFIQPRNYDLLIFGENLGDDSDPYVYWHSSQTHEQGLNLSNYTSVEVDRLLEKGRQSNDYDSRVQAYIAFQKALFEDKPAIFLYQPYYVYAVNQAVQGVNVVNISNPANRFISIDEWYINTERRWK